jgi:hypothetical protein
MNYASRGFWERYSRLTPRTRELADKCYRLFEQDARHSSLQFKRVGRFWSVRISEGYRAVGIDVDSGILWIWIGTHREYEKFIRS